MPIYLIWVEERKYIWLKDAWDQWSIDTNPMDWEQAIEDAKEHDNYKIFKMVVDFDAVRHEFAKITELVPSQAEVFDPDATS